jgi:hypothetical protein
VGCDGRIRRKNNGLIKEKRCQDGSAFFMGEDADTPPVGAGLPAMRPSHPTLMSDEKPLSLASQRLQEIVWIQSLHATRRLSFSAK